jgi:hypothetical protein
MALSVQQGSFKNPTSSTPDTTLSLDFAPAAMVLWGSPHTAAGDAANVGFTFGALSGLSAQRAGMVMSENIATY